MSSDKNTKKEMDHGKGLFVIEGLLTMRKAPIHQKVVTKGKGLLISRLEPIASRLEGIAIRLEAIRFLMMFLLASLLGTSASLLGARALLVVTRSY